MKPKPVFTLLLIFILLSGALPLAAQAAAPEGLTMKATAAFEGYFKYGEWLPIFLELENTGSDLDAEVRIEVSGSQGTTVFVAPVSLPSGSRKQFPIYVLPNNFSRELKVNLVSKGEAAASQKVAVRPQPNISFFIGLISPERGALALLNAITLPGQERPKVVANVLPTDLTERPEGLRSFDVLVLNNTDTSRLTPAQQIALQAWVQTGGRLIIGGGSNAAQTFSGLPEILQPVSLQGSVEVGPESIQGLSNYAGTGEIKSEGPFIASVGMPKDSASILAGSDALPLLVEMGFGGGRVNYAALDLALDPFNGWPGTQDFFEALISPGAAYPENMPFDISIRQMRANQLSYALSNIPSLDLPSVQGLSILLGIYILFVGPMNYLVLRALKRLQLAWVTIPLITLLFTVGAFGIGYSMRGNDVILNRIATIELQPGGSAAVTSYLGLFSPRQQSYEINVQGQGLISPMGGYDQGGWGPGGQPITGGTMEFIQGEPSTIKGLTVNQFSMQSFMAEEIWTNFGTITGELVLDGDVLKGTVKNNTSSVLKDVVVAMQTRFVRLGDLDPGEEANVDIGLGNLTTDRFGAPLSYRLFQDQYSQTGIMPRDIELKTNIVSSVLDNAYPVQKMLSSSWTGGGGGLGIEKNNPITIIAWMDQAPPAVEVKNNRLAQMTTALVFTTLPYSLSDNGFVNIPVGMITGNLTKVPVNGGGSCGPINTASVNMANGEAEFEFNIPTGLTSSQIDSIKLNLWRDQGGDWGLPELAIWDWSGDQWIIIQEPIMGINVIKDPGAYINEGGLVRIKLNSTSTMWSCTYLDMGLEAQTAKTSGGTK